MNLITKIKNHHNDVIDMRLTAERTYDELTKAMNDSMIFAINQNLSIQGFKPRSYMLVYYRHYLPEMWRLNKRCKRSFSKKKIEKYITDMYNVYGVWGSICEKVNLYIELME